MKANRFYQLAGLFLIALIVCISNPLTAQPFGGGTGTREDPYIINTAAHLEEIHTLENGDYIYYDKYFEQRDDIDLIGIFNWQPIGSGVNPFTGSYDGSGYNIENFEYDGLGQLAPVGLFGTNQGTIKNLYLVSPNLWGDWEVGFLVGNNQGTVENCSVVGGSSRYTFIERLEPLYGIGGLVGVNSGTISSSYVDGIDIYYRNILDMQNPIDVPIGDYIGGLAGTNYGSIINSYSFSGSNDTLDGYGYVGGLVGANYYGTITHCYAAIYNIQAEVSSGGLTGYCSGTVTNSYWNSDYVGASASGMGRSTYDMTYPYAQNTYDNWDFDEIWSDDYSGTINFGYPFLLPPHNWKTLSFEGGNGTENNPYRISNAYQMNRIRNYLSAHYVVDSDFNLNVPPWKTGAGWEPIGIDNTPFSGILDGDNHVISGLFIDVNDGSYKGLFGRILGDNNQVSIVRNLTLSGSKIINSQSNIGGLVGEAGDVLILNVHVSGELEGTHCVGGIIGKTISNIQNKTEIISSSADVEIRARAGSPDSFGGLIGQSVGIPARRVNITNCYAIGNIQLITNKHSIGGLIGATVNTNVTNSYANVVIGNGQNCTDIGGFIGKSTGNTYINNCYALGIVNGGTRTGGFIGRIEGNTVILNSYSVGVVVGGDDTGGFAGSYGNGTINNSYWDINTSGQQASAGGDGRTTQEMTYPYDENTYEDWNFFTIWEKDVFHTNNDGYPFLSHQSGFAGGDGTEGNPFLIESSNNLYLVRYYLNAHFLQIADIDLGGNENNWQPIGTEENPFYGRYDGGGYAITNLYINEPEIDDIGLFGFVAGSTEIENLSLADVFVKGRNNVGALIGKAANVNGENSGFVKNCSSSGEVQGTYSNPPGIVHGNHVGGLIGINSTLDVEGCYTTGSVSEFGGYSGGLIGVQSHKTVKNCYSTSTVTQADNVAGYGIGGLIGVLDENGEILHCYSISTLTAIGNPNTSVGGFVGVGDNNDIINSYWNIDSYSPDNDRGEGKTTYEMLNYYTYDGWGFTMGFGQEPVWANWSTDNFNPYILKTYPYHYWQGGPKDHNLPLEENTHVKYICGSGMIIPHTWESFPRLILHEDDEEQWDYTVELLEQLLCENDGIDRVYKSYEEFMEYDYDETEQWIPDELIRFSRLDGYIFRFMSAGEKYLEVSGDWGTDNSVITLQPHTANWVGYYFEPQLLYVALDNILDELSEIASQDGGMSWNENDQSWYGFLDLYAFPGKLYQLWLRGNEPVTLNWNTSTTRNTLCLEEIFNKPKPEYFSFQGGPKYEEYFIEEIYDDYGLQEIGVFAGEECIGAAVFEDKYPIRILTYPEESHAEREIHFVLHRGTRSEEEERIRIVEARNNRTGEYSRQILRPQQQRYTLLRLGAGDYTETVITPLVMMGQNFPNPFVMNTAGTKTGQYRSESPAATNIPIYLSQDMNVEISLFNIRGQRVKTITLGTLTAGKHTFIWDGRNENNQAVGAGIYFYKLESDIETINRKMLIIR